MQRLLPADLFQLRHAPHLRPARRREVLNEAARPFGIWTASALVVGGMVGSGIFVIPAQLAPFGWTGLAAWLAAIAGAMLLAYILSRLAAARPGATGMIAIVGEACSPLAGVLVGWSYWIGICSANAIIALTATRYTAVFAPALTANPLSECLAATSLIWALTFLNLGGAKGAGRFQVLTTALKLVPLVIVVIIVTGLAIGFGPPLSGTGRAAFAAPTLTTALTLAFFPLVGFEAASLCAARVRDPARNILRATLGGTLLTGLLYIVISEGINLALPSATVAASTAPVALFVEQFWGRGAALAVAAFAAIAAIGCLNGWTLLQGETPLGMARAGLLPRWIGRTDRRDVPVAAMLVASSFASLLVLSGAIPGLTGLLTFMLQLTTAATVWLYVGACVAALRLGIARGAAALGMAFAAWVLWGAGLQPLMLSILLMLTAAPLYWLRGSAEQSPEHAPVA